MAFKDILGGRKSRVSTISHINVSPEIAAMVRAFADEYSLYYTEAACYLTAMGVSQYEHWVVDEDEMLQYLHGLGSPFNSRPVAHQYPTARWLEWPANKPSSSGDRITWADRVNAGQNAIPTASRPNHGSRLTV